MTSALRPWKVGLVSALVLTTTCSGDSKSKKEGYDSSSFVARRFNPQVEAIDETGAPVEGAMVSVGGTRVSSKETGVAALPDQGAEDSTVVTIRAEGYAPITKALTFSSSSVPMRVSLRGTVPAQVDSETGGRVENGQAQVSLPARGFVRAADGAPYVGPVNVRSASLPPPQDDEIGATTSDLITDTVEGPLPIRARGQVYVDMSADDGTPVAFAAGQRAGVTFLLDQEADKDLKAGDMLPLWSLNETTGRWEEVSGCKVGKTDSGALSCTGEVEHFSFVAVGNKATKGACVTFKLDTVAYYDVLNWAAGGANWNSSGNGKRGGLEVTDQTHVFGLDDSPGPIDVIFDVSIVGISPPANGHQQVKVQLSPAFTFTLASKIPLAERYDPGAPWKCAQVHLALPPTTVVDRDGDGYSPGAGPVADCNDNDKTVYPGAIQVICDGKDHDCNGKPDVKNLGADLTVETMTDDQWNFYCAQTKKACAAMLQNEVPGNRRDENCDGVISDADGDGFHLKSDPGFAASGKPADCDDTNNKAFPGLPAGREVPGNDVDEDCDGIRSDIDGDGFPSVAEVAFSDKALAISAVDCNDADPEAHPGAMVTDLPILAAYYTDGKRLPSFCDLFDKAGKPTNKLRYLMFLADRNCDGYLEDLDGDGKLVSFAGDFGKPNAGPFDPNDLDPRIKVSGDSAPADDPACATPPDLTSFGADARQVCPRPFNQQQRCIEAQRNGVGTGEFLCTSADYRGFTIPPNPLGIKQQYGPCSTTVLAECSTDPATMMMSSLCAGPISFAPEYVSSLKAQKYDISMESFLGFCMPVCNVVPAAK